MGPEYRESELPSACQGHAWRHALDLSSCKLFLPALTPCPCKCSAGRPAWGAAVQHPHWDVPHSSEKGTNTWLVPANERGHSQEETSKGKPSVWKIIYDHIPNLRNQWDVWCINKMKSREPECSLGKNLYFDYLPSKLVSIYLVSNSCDQYGKGIIAKI